MATPGIAVPCGIGLMLLIGCLGPEEEGLPESAELATMASVASATTTWECYSPQPGHPTSSEKTGWIDRARAAAQEAEATYGVPAAGILAMTANEGGYGFTRTALYASNPFGWKWSSSEAAGGRTYYTLTCQPSWDPNNKYVKFSDVRDAILFVSYKLATLDTSWSPYKPVTDRYKLDRQNGVSVVTAVNRWFDGIADAGYNYDPATYKATLKKFANNYMSPSTTYSDTYNLYKHSLQPAASVWVSIDSPQNGAAVAGVVPFTASTGGGTVTSVQFSSRAVGSTNAWYVIGTDTSAPYGVNWATDPWVPNGAYELRVEAYNGTNKLATGTYTVSVSNP